MFKLDGPIKIDHDFPNFVSIYSLNIISLIMDDYAIRIHFKITPPAPMVEREPMFFWRGYAVDNFGNRYESNTGTCGIFTDTNGEKYTKGLQIFSPRIEQSILFLDVTMIAPIRPEMKDRVECKFRVIF